MPIHRLVIPGYDEALAKEKRLRDGIFLDVPYDICGIKVRNITPFLLARLQLIKSPFIEGNDEEYSEEETLRFLWTLSPVCVTEPRKYRVSNFFRRLVGMRRLSQWATRDAFIEDAHRYLAQDDRYAQAWDEIDQFISDTFMDAPMGGAESVPYVTPLSWFIFTMGQAPFHWPEEKTKHEPLRKIYQLRRCAAYEKGAVMYNRRSDMVKQRFMDEIRANSSPSTKGGANG